MSIFKILLLVHIFCGALSLLLGMYILIVKKGDNVHKKIGNFYFFSMLIAAVISLLMSCMHPNYFLFIIGVFTTYMLLTGRRYLGKKQLSNVTFIDWGLTIFMLIFALAFLGFGLNKLLCGNSFGIVFLVFGGISSLFVWQDNRNFRGKSRYKNFWLTMHIQRMVASYIATFTAFLVVNNKFLPATIAWLMPTVLLVPLIIKWTKKHHIKNSKN